MIFAPVWRAMRRDIEEMIEVTVRDENGIDARTDVRESGGDARAVRHEGLIGARCARD